MCMCALCVYACMYVRAQVPAFLCDECIYTVCSSGDRQTDKDTKKATKHSDLLSKQIT